MPDSVDHLRILMVTDSYPPVNLGGATRDTQLLSRALVRRGHAVDVATPWQVGTPAWEDDRGVGVHRLKGLSARVSWFSSDPAYRHHPPLPDPAAVWEFRRLIGRLRPDIVHSYGWVTYSCVAAMPRTGLPLLLSARDYSNTCAIRTLVQQRPDGERTCAGPAPRRCLACATRYYGSAPKATVAVGGVLGGRVLLKLRITALHSCSAYMQDIMRRDLLEKRELSLEPRGVTVVDEVIPSFRDDSADGAPDEAILASLPAAPFILFVGALRPVKGLGPLLDAYARLDAPPPLALLGPRTPETPASFPDGVTVVPGASHATVMAAWERALFGVAPSLLPEPFGNVVHEGMSKGRAMIGTAPSGMSDMIVDGETGLLVPPGDVGALTEALGRLIGDAELRERLGAAACERARLFTADAVMPRFERLYRRVMAASGEDKMSRSRHSVPAAPAQASPHGAESDVT